MQVTNLLFEEFYNLITSKAKVDILLKLLDKPILNDNIKESFITFCESNNNSQNLKKEVKKEVNEKVNETPEEEVNNESQELQEEKFRTLVDSLFDSDVEIYKEQKRQDLLNSQPVEYIQPKNDLSEYDKIENLPSVDTPTEEKNSFYKNKATRVFSKMTIQKRNETTQRLLNDAIKMIKKEDLPEDQETIDKYFEIRLRMFLDTFVN